MSDLVNACTSLAAVSLAAALAIVAVAFLLGYEFCRARIKARSATAYAEGLRAGIAITRPDVAPRIRIPNGGKR